MPEEQTKYHVCARCGAAMPPGALKYLVRIEVLADWDGHLTMIADEEERGRAIRDALTAMADRDEADLLREVYHRELHVLSKGCRDRYLVNPLNLPLPEALA